MTNETLFMVWPSSWQRQLLRAAHCWGLALRGAPRKTCSTPGVLKITRVAVFMFLQHPMWSIVVYFYSYLCFVFIFIVFVFVYQYCICIIFIAQPWSLAAANEEEHWRWEQWGSLQQLELSSHLKTSWCWAHMIIKHHDVIYGDDDDNGHLCWHNRHLGSLFAVGAPETMSRVKCIETYN